MEGLRRLAASITRFTDGDGGGVPAGDRSAGEFDVSPVAAARRRCGCSMGSGARWGSTARWPGVLGARRFTTDVERVLFALVANRALDPLSKLAGVGVGARVMCTSPGLRGWTRTSATGRWTCWSRPTPRRWCRRRCSSPAPTCSTSRSTCCSSTRPRPTSSATSPRAGEGAFRVFGHSKDHRPDLPQIVIGLAVTREGIPVRVWCWPGNTTDMTVIARGQGRARAAGGSAGWSPSSTAASPAMRTCAT